MHTYAQTGAPGEEDVLVSGRPAIGLGSSRIQQRQQQPAHQPSSRGALVIGSPAREEGRPRGTPRVERQADQEQQGGEQHQPQRMMATALGQQEEKGGQGAMAMLGEGAENGTGGAGAYGGASRKLEELFTYWLSQKETAEMVEHCVTAVRQGQALPCDPGLESPQLTLRGLSGAAAAHMSLVPNQPPRSPREPSAHSPPGAASPLGLNKRPLASISTAGAGRGGGSGMMVEDEPEPRPQPGGVGLGAGAEDRQTKVMDESNDAEDEAGGGALSASASTSTSPFSSPPALLASPIAPGGAAMPGAGAGGAGGAGGSPLQPLQAAHQRRLGAAFPPTAAAATPPPVLRVPLDGGGTGGRGRPYPDDSLEKRRPQIEAMYTRLVGASGRRGLTAGEMGEFTKNLCRLPRFLHVPLFERVWALYGGGGSKAGAGAGAADGDSRMAEERDAQDGAPSPPSTELAGAAIRGENEAAGASAPPEGGADAPAPAEGEEGERVLPLEALLRFWESEMAPFDDVDRLFRLLKQPGSSHIVKEDLFPLLKQLLEAHPGLEFLRSHPDFQQKYALTVAARVFYSLNRSGTGKITPRELRRSRLLAAMRFVDENEDINKETAFFSYEHFYVLYCRFWELDTDRDGALSREDLLKYGEHSLSNVIVDRVFEVGARPFEDGLGGKRRSKERERMQYEDFIFFMLSEEDKGNEASLRYWFHCVDVDGDGRLSLQDMRYFYNVQLQRMEWLGHELVPFEDVLCQMLDMLKPTREIGAHLQACLSAAQQQQQQLQHLQLLQQAAAAAAVPLAPAAGAAGAAALCPAAAALIPAASVALAAQEAEVRVGGLHIEDFLRPDKMRIAGVFFDALFNLNKFIQFEQRDPFGDRQKREDPFDSDWERFAYRDYQQLAMDEEENEGGGYSEEAEEHQVTSMDIEDEEEDDEEDDEEDGAGGGDRDAAAAAAGATPGAADEAGASASSSSAAEGPEEAGGKAGKGLGVSADNGLGAGPGGEPFVLADPPF